jgi:Lon protease-like protein
MNYTLETRLPHAVPVLPLEGEVLLPATAAPFRVTDPRHRRLIEDLLDKPLDQRWVAVPERVDASSPECATLGLVTVATPLAGGEFIIVVEGRSACRLESGTLGEELGVPYPIARIRHLVDRPEALETARAATTSLIQALFSLYDCFGIAASELPMNEQPVDDAGLVYRIGSAVIEQANTRGQMLAERCPRKRRELVMGQVVDQLAFAMRERLLGRPAERC